MRRLALSAVLALSIVAPSLADRGMWAMHEGDGTVTSPDGITSQILGQQGISCDAFNRMAGLTWLNKGGDWRDQNNTMNPSTGAVPFAAVTVGTVSSSGSPQLQTFNVTNMIGVEGFALRRTNSSVLRIATRNAASNRPILEVTTPGGVVTLEATADMSLQFVQNNPPICSTNAIQKSTVASVNPMVVIQFPEWPVDATAATLKVWVTENSNTSSLQVYEMVVPRHTTSQANLVPVHPSPGIFWSEDFNETVPVWWDNMGGPAWRDLLPWTQDEGTFRRDGYQNGIWRANGSPHPVLAQGTTDVYVPRGIGWNNTNGLMYVYHKDDLGVGVEFPEVNIKNILGGEQNEVWLRYMLKFDPNFHSFKNAEGGKLPGLAAGTNYCAQSGIPDSGYCGWSLRQAYETSADPSNPAFDKTRVVTYSYTTEAPGPNGQHWYGDHRSLLTRGQWYCIEQRVKVNTPGVADGINQLYVDGVLVLDRQGVYMRGQNPAIILGNPAYGYGPWQSIGNTGGITMPPGAPTFVDPVTGKTIFKYADNFEAGMELGIKKLMWVNHNGGLTPPKKNAQMWQDEMVMSLNRAGCPTTAPVLTTEQQLQAQVAALTAQVASLQSQALTTAAQITNLQDQVASLSASRATALADLAIAQANLAASQATLASTLTQLDDASDQIQQLTSTIATRDATIVTLTSTVAARDATIAARDVTIATLRTQLQDAQNVIAAAKVQVNAVKSTLDGYVVPPFVP